MDTGFSPEETEAVYKALALRRDIRHFVPGEIDPGVFKRLLWAAHIAPSVGMMQPWRLIRITDDKVRDVLYDAVQRERVRTAAALGERDEEFLKLKVEGIKECAEVVVVALMDGREKHVFGRRTIPEMDLASTACAIQNMWLAARAEGIGMGWVSLFAPHEVKAALQMPTGSEPIAILCLGHVEKFYPKPMLEIEGWAQRHALEDVVMENVWRADSSQEPTKR